MAPKWFPKRGTVAWKVIHFLRKEIPRTFQPKTIAREIREDPGTVRKALQRMMGRNQSQVVRVDRGWYRAFIDGEGARRMERPAPMLHAIQIRVRTGGAVSRNGGLPPRGGGWFGENKQTFEDAVWRGRKVTFQFSNSTRVLLVSVQASNDPLAPREFESLRTWLEGRLDGMGYVLTDRAELVTLEMNQDYHKLSLRDAKSLKLGKFRNAWAQIYEKAKDTVRRELRIHPELELGEAVEMLRVLQEPPERFEPAGEPPGGMYG